MSKTITETPIEKVFHQAGIFFCKDCGEGYHDDDNLTSIKAIGSCMKCDHIQAERYGDQDLPF